MHNDIRELNAEKDHGCRRKNACVTLPSLPDSNPSIVPESLKSSNAGSTIVPLQKICIWRCLEMHSSICDESRPPGKDQLYAPSLVLGQKRSVVIRGLVHRIVANNIYEALEVTRRLRDKGRF